MRFNSRELSAKLAELNACGHETIGCGGGCSYPSVFEDELKREKSKKDGETQDPGKKKESYNLAGLELLRAQLRESLGGAAR